MRNLSILLALFLGLGLARTGQAQDPHLSQFYYAPLQVNPALTGVIECDYRAGLLYRSQWAEVLRDEEFGRFQTVVGSADLRFGVGQNAIGVGFRMMSDKAGQSQFATLRGGLSLSYQQRLTKWKKHYLSVGLQGDFIQRSFDLGGLRFGNQWNSGLGIYDPTIDADNPAYLNSLNQQFIFFTASAGLLWFMEADRNERVSAYAGVSMQHINEPNQSFETRGQDLPAAILPNLLIVHGGARFPIFGSFDLMPKFLAQFQGQAYETLVGTEFRYNINPYEPNESGFHFGALYRGVGGLRNATETGFNTESLILLTGFDLKGFDLGVSYDMNLSDFRAATFSRGAFEIAASYTGCFNKRYSDNVTCPKF